MVKDDSPLVLYRTYERGLLPTPKIKPLRRVIWVAHPIIEIEHALNQAKEKREFTFLHESGKCEYSQGVYLKYLVSIYGEKIARLSFDPDEAMKLDIEDDFTPRTRYIYQTLEGELVSALQDASRSENRRSDSSQKI